MAEIRLNFNINYCNAENNFRPIQRRAVDKVREEERSAGCFQPALRLCPWPCNAASLEPIRSHRSFSAGHRRSRGEIRNPKLQIRNKQKIQKKKIPKPVPGPWKE